MPFFDSVMMPVIEPPDFNFISSPFPKIIVPDNKMYAITDLVKIVV